eukprot:GHUV01051444.1.p1 GENE.GHUV01051444.1~~GHUV01051444.1.p1  ORF type:complete len:149 (+),score=6.71 GHUV01051444.1:707-1153(+)
MLHWLVGILNVYASTHMLCQLHTIAVAASCVQLVLVDRSIHAGSHRVAMAADVMLVQHVHMSALFIPAAVQHCVVQIVLQVWVNLFFLRTRSFSRLQAMEPKWLSAVERLVPSCHASLLSTCSGHCCHLNCLLQGSNVRAVNHTLNHY